MKSIYRKKLEWSMRNVMILAVVLIILMPVLTVSLFAYKILKDKLYEEFYRMN